MISKLWIALLALLFTTTSWAAATYSITANPYTSVGGTIPRLYATTDNASGSFTMAAQLTGGLSNSNVTASVTSFSFDDGKGNVITEANATARSFQVSTDLGGTITDFDISVSLTGPPARSIRLYTGDGGGIQVSNGGQSATRLGDPGSFNLTITADPVVTNTSVPTLSEWALITLAGLMLAGVALQQNRRRS